jgi:anti-anti-sigma regulatory factor
MATNFKITVGREKNCLHLKLNGHFDGSSAYELIHLLKKLGGSNKKVVIHTDSLRHIYSFGRNILLKNLRLLTSQGLRIIFTGENAREILPEHGGNFEGISLFGA